MDIWKYCTCEPGRICLYCKVLAVLCITFLSLVLGYIIGKRKVKGEQDK